MILKPVRSDISKRLFVDKERYSVGMLEREKSSGISIDYLKNNIDFSLLSASRVEDAEARIASNIKIDSILIEYTYDNFAIFELSCEDTLKFESAVYGNHRILTIDKYVDLIGDVHYSSHRQSINRMFVKANVYTELGDIKVSIVPGDPHVEVLGFTLIAETV